MIVSSTAKKLSWTISSDKWIWKCLKYPLLMMKDNIRRVMLGRMWTIMQVKKMWKLVMMKRSMNVSSMMTQSNGVNACWSLFWFFINDVIICPCMGYIVLILRFHYIGWIMVHITLYWVGSYFVFFWCLCLVWVGYSGTCSPFLFWCKIFLSFLVSPKKMFVVSTDTYM